MARLVLSEFKEDPMSYSKSLNAKDLVRLLTRLDKKYHVDMDPSVPNWMYDEAKEVLLAKFPDDPYAKKVGHSVGKKEVTLPFGMPSLDKIKAGTKAYNTFMKRNVGPFTIMDKLDGISLEILFNDGKPFQAFTRGDGIKGQDVSRHIVNFKIPKRIPSKELTAIRFEFILDGAAFDKHFSKEAGNGKYDVTRNAAGGLLRNFKETPSIKKVRVIAYEIIKGKGSTKKMSAQLKLLNSYGFDTVWSKTVKELNEDKLQKLLTKRKTDAPYEMDGLVVFQDDPYKRVKSNEFPRYAAAFKENDLAAAQLVTVTGITWEYTRTGKCFPTLQIKPTKIGGVTVTNFTGFSAYFILNGFRYKERNEGKPIRPLGKGAVMRVLRSGDVIPHILGIEKGVKEPEMPSQAFKMKGAHAFVIQKQDSSHQKSLVHFFNTMKIDGIKSGTVKKLSQSGYSNLVDILNMDMEDWMSLPGIKETSARKFYLNIQSGLKQTDFVTIAHASNVFPSIGTTRFEALISTYPRILNAIRKKAPYSKVFAKIRTIDNMGDITASQIAKGLPKLIDFIDELDITIKPPKKVVQSGSTMAGKSITFTGARDKSVEAWVTANGGKVVSMRKTTTILVISTATFTSAKVDKAKDDNIPVLTMDQFKNKYIK